MAEEKKNNGLYEWVQALVCSVLTAVLLFTFGVRVVGVSGDSMRNTLQNGDMLLVVNNLLCGTYHQGDIVIAAKPAFESGEPIVKRVIATEGQTVDIDFNAGAVYVDGMPLNEPYIREATHLAEGTEFPLTVPEGCVFIMGDNRNNSRDSRDPDLGVVDTRYVIGRAVFLLLPGETAEKGQREWSRTGKLN
ncbi:MAG: signal peptidase I [Oscillibacter sp.]|nr:signal peptidase I [Oscillibacter sp.]